MWPECFIEALEVSLNGCTGGEERDRGTLLSAFTVGPWGLSKLALAVLGVGFGYGAVLKTDDLVPLTASRTCEYVFDTRFPYGCAEHALDVILDEDVVWVLFHEESRSKHKSLTACWGSHRELVRFRKRPEAISVGTECRISEEAEKGLSITDESVICVVVNPRLAFV